MPADVAPTVTQQESTDVRFRLRTLLVLMAAAAMLASIVGPYVRHLQPAEQIRVLIACSIWLAMVVIWICVAAFRRLGVERLAGKAILRLPIYGIDYHWRRFSLYLVSMGLATIGLVGMYLVVERAIRVNSIGGAAAHALSVSSIVTALLAAHSVAMWWWNHHARISEAGILWDRRLIRWAEVNQWWDSEREILTFVGPDQLLNVFRCEVVVPEQLLEAVTAIVEERTSAKRQSTKSLADKGDPCPTIR